MLVFILVIACTIMTGLSVYSVHRLSHRRWTQREGEPTRRLPPVSVLKPLCGVDDALEDNLETFFQLSYPHYELVFGIEGSTDPAAELVRRLSKRHPEVACRLVIHSGGRAINPKVSNLRAMMAAVSHDIVVISDSNIAVAPTYLTVLVDELEQERVGLVTNVFTGVGERTLGARLENLHLNGLIAGSVASSHELAGRTITVGKSMAFRRSVFTRLGGFESIATVLAEDYIIGRMFREAGFEVRLAPQVIQTVCTHTPVRSFLRRHLRWNLMRSRLQPLLYPVEVIANPIGVAILALALGAPLIWSVVWALALVILRDGCQWWMLRGPHGLASSLPFSPLKEALVLVLWVIAPLFRHVSWRGNRVRLSAGTRLYATNLR